MRFGYARVSTKEQNTARQVEALAGVDEMVIEKESGKDIESRPLLQALLLRVREGDELICKSIDRLARNTKQLLELVEDLTERGVKVTFLDNSMTFDNTPTSRFILTMMGAVGELERGVTLARQREGIRIAKEQGVYKGRGKDAGIRERVLANLDRGLTVSDIAKLSGCGVATVYRIKKESVLSS